MGENTKMSLDSTWLGIGVKGGTQLGIGGVEAIEGMFYNLGNTNMRRSFSMVSSRWGLGYGWDGGLFVSIYFRTNELYWLNGTTVRDWGVNVALGTKWNQVAEYLHTKNFSRNVKFARNMYNIIMHLDEIRDAISHIYNTYNFDISSDPHPNIIIDIPGSGIGTELSVFKTKGTMYLDEA